jgi:hypothetical protein
MPSWLSYMPYSTQEFGKIIVLVFYVFEPLLEVIYAETMSL